MDSLAVVFRLVLIVLVLGCFAGFAPAIVHARDNVDRLYLLGGVAILAGIAIGSFVHLHSPFNPSIPITMGGLILWALSALKSRKRRRNRFGGAGRE